MQHTVAYWIGEAVAVGVAVTATVVGIRLNRPLAGGKQHGDRPPTAWIVIGRAMERLFRIIPDGLVAPKPIRPPGIPVERPRYVYEKPRKL